jgi:hypothetical protein
MNKSNKTLAKNNKKKEEPTKLNMSFEEAVALSLKTKMPNKIKKKKSA